jgi:hypothetical protein
MEKNRRIHRAVIGGGWRVPKDQQLFGGEWTQDKLEQVRKCLVEYVKALKNQSFNLVYIEAFAGTGYRLRG